MTESLETLIQRHNLCAGFTPIPSRTDGLPWDEPKGPEWALPMHFAYTLSADHGGITGCFSVGVGHLRSYKGKRSNTRLLKDERRRYRPKTVDLVCSLLWDASFDPETTFREWCEEFGYDLNPADALDTFRVLRETRSKMMRILGADFDAALELAQEM